MTHNVLWSGPSLKRGYAVRDSRLFMATKSPSSACIRT